ncbi:MAG: SWIM zinc finger family protein [Bradymonadia bacterium]
MSGEEKRPEGEKADDPSGASKSPFSLKYPGASEVIGEDGGTRIALFGESGRPTVSATAEIGEPVAVREALSALYEVVKSDFRYKPKDRSAWLAYQAMKKQTATMSVWQAQQAYFSWLSRNDPNAWLILDPIVSVHPDAVTFEVFSKDEGTYAQLSLDAKALKIGAKGKPAPTFGTTNVDFSDALFNGVQRMRSYRNTTLTLGDAAGGAGDVGLETEGQPKVIEKQINVPDAWLRGFLQVQSAATLPASTFSLAPIDLYNVMRTLRLKADQKRKGRAIRVELVPGEPPRLVLEPWEEIIPSSSANYEGRTAHVIRIWGRRRLMLLRRLMPFIESVDVHLLGSGMPSFFVFRCGAVTFTLGLTGFSSANWAQSLNFDVLLPRPEGEPEGLDKVLEHLGEKWSDSAKGIGKATGLKGADLTAALQGGCQAGRLMYDIARDVYRLRPLTAEPLKLDTLAHRNTRERQARDLLATDGAVKITQENRIFGRGVEITGKVVVAADQREYRCELLIDDEGRVTRASCSSPFFRKHALKHGPSAPLIALALKYAEERKKAAEGRGKARNTITVETRTYTRRHSRGEALYQLSLNRTRLKVRWGQRADARLRVQSLVFDTVADARAAYFARVDELESQGYLDATAG